VECANVNENLRTTGMNIKFRPCNTQKYSKVNIFNMMILWMQLWLSKRELFGYL